MIDYYPSVALLPLRPVRVVAALVQREAGLEHRLVHQSHDANLKIGNIFQFNKYFLGPPCRAAPCRREFAAESATRSVTSGRR